MKVANPSSQDRTPYCAILLAVPPAAVPYRASGLVQQPFTDVGRLLLSSAHSGEQFQRLMADHGIVCSMSRSGIVWDNAAMESFFSSLKTERTASNIIEPERHAPMCSTTSNDSINRPAGTRPSAILARLSSSAR